MIWKKKSATFFIGPRCAYPKNVTDFLWQMYLNMPSCKFVKVHNDGQYDE